MASEIDIIAVLRDIENRAKKITAHSVRHQPVNAINEIAAIAQVARTAIGKLNTSASVCAAAAKAKETVRQQRIAAAQERRKGAGAAPAEVKIESKSVTIDPKINIDALKDDEVVDLADKLGLQPKKKGIFDFKTKQVWDTKTLRFELKRQQAKSAGASVATSVAK